MEYLHGIIISMGSTMVVDPERAILATILMIVGGGTYLSCQKQTKCKGIVRLWKKIRENQGFCGFIKQCLLHLWMC